MTKRATARAAHTVGKMAAAVYKYGGVTRRDAMVVCDHYGVSDKRIVFRAREEKDFARRQVTSSELYKSRRNRLEGDPGRDSIIMHHHLRSNSRVTVIG